MLSTFEYTTNPKFVTEIYPESTKNFCSLLEKNLSEAKKDFPGQKKYLPKQKNFSPFTKNFSRRLQKTLVIWLKIKLPFINA